MQLQQIYILFFCNLEVYKLNFTGVKLHHKNVMK